MCIWTYKIEKHRVRVSPQIYYFKKKKQHGMEIAMLQSNGSKWR